MSICFVITLIPVFVNILYRSLDKGGSVLYTAITVRLPACLGVNAATTRGKRQRQRCALHRRRGAT